MALILINFSQKLSGMKHAVTQPLVWVPFLIRAREHRGVYRPRRHRRVDEHSSDQAAERLHCPRPSVSPVMFVHHPSRQKLRGQPLIGRTFPWRGLHPNPTAGCTLWRLCGPD